LRSVCATSRLDLEDGAACEDVALIVHIREGERVSGSGGDVFEGGTWNEDGAVVVPLNGDDGLRTLEDRRAGVIQQHGKICVAIVVLGTTSPAEKILGIGNPPEIG